MTTRQSSATLTWMSQALCATTRPDLPWLADGPDISKDDSETMSRVCRRCPVLGACTRHARATKVTGGFWAGLHRDPEAALPMRWSA